MLVVDMMVFSEQSTAEARPIRKRKPKKWLIIGVFVLILGTSWWVMQPSNKPGSGSSADGSANITGKITGLEGQVISNGDVTVVNSKGRTVNSMAVSQDGTVQFFLPNGDYTLTVKSLGQQESKKFKVGGDNPKTVDIQLNVTSEY